MPIEGDVLASLDGEIVPREQQNRLGAVVPAEAITVLTQCSRLYVEKAAVALADRQQQHVNYVDARFTSLAAEFVAHSETMSRVLAHTHEAQAGVQAQLDELYQRLVVDVKALVDSKLCRHNGVVGDDLLKRAAMYASEAQAARDSSQTTLALLEHQLANAVRKDAYAFIGAQLAKIQAEVDANLLKMQASTDSKLAAIERRLEAVINDRYDAALAAQSEREDVVQLGANLGQLRDQFGGEIDHIRAAIVREASASEEIAIQRALELIQERVQEAMRDARGLFESKIRASESHFLRIAQDEAARVTCPLSVEQHLPVLKEHIDAQIRDATLAMHAYLETSHVRAESRIAALIASQTTDQLTDERVLQLVCERVGVELQDVDERILRKLELAHEQMMVKAKHLFEALVQCERASGHPQERAAAVGDVGARFIRGDDGKYHVFVRDRDDVLELDDLETANDNIAHVVLSGKRRQAKR